MVPLAGRRRSPRPPDPNRNSRPHPAPARALSERAPSAARFRLVPCRRFPVRGVHLRRSVRKLHRDPKARPPSASGDSTEPPTRPSLDGSTCAREPASPAIETGSPIPPPTGRASARCRFTSSADGASAGHRIEADARQVQPVRVLAQPLEQRLLPLAAGGVAHLPPIGIEPLEAQFGRSQALRHRGAVPSPLRLRAQRHGFS